MNTDYRALLIKYIELVGSEEGSDFLSRIGGDGSCSNADVRFAPEEITALQDASAARGIP